jgi:hypothetical protein
MTMSSAPVATSTGTRSLWTGRRRHRGATRPSRQPADEQGRETAAPRGGHDIAELEVDGLGEILGNRGKSSRRACS